MTSEPGLKKRSVTIAGHRTSVSLEDEFWEELQEAARQESVSLAVMITGIDAGRGRRSLSSAIRVFLLKRAKSGTVQSPVTEPSPPPREAGSP
ncbi:ribbon-helix-helix domain-containing protein [Lutibaculum baratangense]|uniref:ribbon-helix-helix domain-containing protein n=1 Tax=Lutibaculum baratangense TaxID=1358440 RepID=UPI00058B6107|nr:ribbon-helix-helix domain-containing protein [Lutibaculum baratangense]